MKKYNGLDIVKFLMAVMVVAIHTYPLNKETNYILSVIAQCAVPFFFITSSFLLFEKVKRNNGDIQLIKKYMKNMIKLYVIWTIIYIPITIYNFKKNNLDVSTSIISFIKGFIFVGENWYSWPLWYLLSTIYGIIVIYLLIKLKKEKLILPISTCIFVSSFIIDKIVLKTDLTGNLLEIKKIIDFTIINGRILRGIFYLSIGMLFSKYNEKLQNFKLGNIIIINVILFITSIMTNNELVIQLWYIMTFVLALKINIKDRIEYYYLRRSSTIIYFVHMIIFFIWTLYKGPEKCYGLRAFVFTTIISIAFSACILIFDNKKNVKALKVIFN